MKRSYFPANATQLKSLRPKGSLFPVNYFVQWLIIGNANSHRIIVAPTVLLQIIFVMKSRSGEDVNLHLISHGYVENLEEVAYYALHTEE